MTSTTLSNGIVIDSNTRASTGYKQSSFNSKQRQYLAWVNKESLVESDPRVNLVQPGSSPTFTLGWFDDSREAAYAAAFFTQHRDIILNEYFTHVVSTDGKIDRQQVFSVVRLDFPKDLYDLPKGVEHTARAKAIKAIIKSDRRIRKNVVAIAMSIDSRPAKDFIVAKHGFPTVKNLIAKFGRDVVQTAHDNLSVNEYELRFGI
jgi:hypothetical protein